MVESLQILAAPGDGPSPRQSPDKSGRDGRAPLTSTKAGGVWIPATAFLLACLAFTTRALGQGVEQQLKSFGFTNLEAANSYAPVIQGSDGALYGTTANGGVSRLGTVFKISTNGTGYSVLHSFTRSDGYSPLGGLVQGNDGSLYGTTYQGGTNTGGTVFKLSTDGTGYSVLYSFTGTDGDGQNPEGSLIQGSDGMLYGTTQNGGTGIGYGTVFKLSTDGTGYSVLYSFTYAGGDEAHPVAGVVQGSDGMLYGTTGGGGASGYGAVFKLATDGTGYSVLHRFTNSAGDGGFPYGLIQASNGALYGTTHSGGADGVGTVYKLSTDGTGYSVLYSFLGSPNDGSSPETSVVQGGDGALYGVTGDGGASGNGAVYRLSTDGTGYSVLYSLNNSGGDGSYPDGIVQGRDGTLYGTTAYGGASGAGTVFRLSTGGTGYSVLCSFSSSGGDGQNPYAGLVQGSDAVLYGTTEKGGACGYGSVYKLTTNGTGYSVLYSFTNSGGDGANPYAGLAQGTDGALYGTTAGGGADGYGTVFRLTTNGTGYSVLHRFTNSGGDGRNPYARLVQGSDGALYGTTYSGGARGYGTVFKLSTSGTAYSVLYSFTFSPGDGAYPLAGLMQARDGALYGTTYDGGTNGGGTVFKLSTDGTGYSVLHSFGTSGADAHPGAGLVQGRDGALYGMTAGDQNGGNAGAVFKLSTDGTGYSVLYSSGYFYQYEISPPSPQAGVILGNDGVLYGTTYFGALFKLATDGTGFSLLYSFGASAEDGQRPTPGLVQGPDGAFYGATYGGGAAGYGTVFRFGAPPSVGISTLPDRNIQISFLALPNYTSAINVTTDLVHWTTLTSFPGSNGPVQFDDLSATNFSQRYYRALWTPAP